MIKAGGAPADSPRVTALLITVATAVVVGVWMVVATNWLS